MWIGYNEAIFTIVIYSNCDYIYNNLMNFYYTIVTLLSIYKKYNRFNTKMILVFLSLIFSR